MDEKEIQELIRKLNDSDPEVRKSAIIVLKSAAQNGQDISTAFLALGNTLSDRDKWIRTFAAQAFEYAAEKGQNIIPAVPNLLSVLSDEDWIVVACATRAINIFLGDFKSVSELNNFQGIIETSFSEWLKKQPSGRTKEKVDMELKLSSLLMNISKKKAELSKGELLLGTTVEKPKDSGKKIYRSLRRVSRNG
jgi:HEAT repeat protein